MQPQKFRDAKPINFGKTKPAHYAVHGVDVSRWQGDINWAKLREHGANVITIEEETVYPWRTAQDLARELDAVAKANGVTLAASGAQDVFWLHLVGTLLGAVTASGEPV